MTSFSCQKIQKYETRGRPCTKPKNIGLYNLTRSAKLQNFSLIRLGLIIVLRPESPPGPYDLFFTSDIDVSYRLHVAFDFYLSMWSNRICTCFWKLSSIRLSGIRTIPRRVSAVWIAWLVRPNLNRRSKEAILSTNAPYNRSWDCGQRGGST